MTIEVEYIEIDGRYWIVWRRDADTAYIQDSAYLPVGCSFTPTKAGEAGRRNQ